MHNRTGRCGSRKPKSLKAACCTPTAVEVVEGVEAESKKPKYVWQMEAGLDRNFRKLGKLLASLGLQLYRHRESGLLLVEDDQIQHVMSGEGTCTATDRQCSYRRDQKRQVRRRKALGFDSRQRCCDLEASSTTSSR